MFSFICKATFLSPTILIFQVEDDGIILSALLWGGTDTNRVGLLILDAQTFTELGRAEFYTPGPIPKCLHGWFLPYK